MQGRQAIAIALLGAALAVAGCGLGPGDDLGQAGITVTRDFGAEQVVAPISDEVNESDTVMRVLERDAEITTRYGGGFVQSIDGLEGDYGGGRSFDWFFYVNGVESTVGAADVQLQGGEAVWWDYHDWSASTSIPADRRLLAAAFRRRIRGARAPDRRRMPGRRCGLRDCGIEAPGRRRDADLLRERRRPDPRPGRPLGPDRIGHGRLAARVRARGQRCLRPIRGERGRRGPGRPRSEWRGGQALRAGGGARRRDPPRRRSPRPGSSPGST